MPNFQTKHIHKLHFPHVCENVTFFYEAKNDNESLIFTKTNDEFFFIKEIRRKDNILIKGDKLSKPSLVKTLQDTLLTYQKATKSKPLHSNLHTKKNRQEKKSDIVKNIDFFAHKFKNLQSTYQETWIDIGFGSGRHILHQAKQNPNILHVGVEIHKPSIEQVTKQCKLQNLDNIIIIDYDARVLLEFISSNSISRIFVHFPIPWDKKPHRRVICDEFVHNASRVLRPQGKLEVRTDSQLYYQYTVETFSKLQKTSFSVFKNKELEITSKYEQRWKKMQKDIYDIIYLNEEKSEEKNIPSPLNFDHIKSLPAKSNPLKKETILSKNWFVHFETCYTTENKNFIWRVAFGDTSCVEHCYLIIKDNVIRYFPNTIYATKNNLLAHNAICERLTS